MGARAWTFLVCVSMLAAASACGGDDPPGETMAKPDAALDPSSKDAGRDAAAPSDASTTEDAAPQDSGSDAGDAGADSGPSDGDSSVQPPEETSDPPAEWSCPTTLWNDGWCDCGCGAHDADCPALDCVEPGCRADRCDACFTLEGNWKSCDPEPDPDARSCDEAVFSDAICDCGCGIPDPACSDEGCSEPGCRRVACTHRHNCDEVTETSDTCSVVNPITLTSGEWACPWDSYGGGDGCDCGCGARDPDCNGSGCTDPQCYQLACDRCNDQDGRPYPCDAAQGGWDALNEGTSEPSQCDPARYNAGDGCDCGCGGRDPDCGDDGCDTPSCGHDACDRCTDGNGLPIGCAPGTWKCPPENYGTGDGCDCGCGVDDPDCTEPGSASASSLLASCDVCHDGTTYDPGDPAATYVECPGWTCDEALITDGSCDCGCGTIDPYCRYSSLFSCTEPGCTSPTCDSCADENGSRSACTTSWRTADMTCSNLQYYGLDGLCDCGCGATDPDCGNAGCTDAGCSAPGCDVCHGNNLLAVCDSWYCDLARFDEGGADHCDCGCGAIDPDCGSGGCKDPGCSDAACDVCYDNHNRAVPCP